MTQRRIEQELAINGHSFFQTVGDSMEPMLHNRKSTVVIAAKKAPLKKYDVALYRRPTGEYVLHRVLKVLDGAYLICGDNRIWKEMVPEAWVIGVVTDYYPDEHDRPVSRKSEVYQQYLKTLWWRYSLLWIRAFPGRARHKMVSLFRGRKGNKKTF